MATKPKNTNEYLKTKVLTASPEQLQLMLYDGAIRFTEQARVAIFDKDIEQSHNLLCKAQNIVMELATAMRDELAPDTCAQMRALYMFCYDRLVATNLNKDLTILDESLQILRHMRQTWLLLIEKLKQENSDQSPSLAEEADPPDSSGAHIGQEVGATVNFQG